MSDPVLLNDFRAQWQAIAEPVLRATREVGESGWYVLGKEVRAFESQLAATLGVPHVVGCGSGLDAIEIALRANGLRAGERVLTTPLSAFATSLAIVRAGGVPVFVDVDASGLMDLSAAERCLAEDPSIRFLLPVHLYGHVLDLERLRRLQRDRGITVIEDAAQAIGARFRGEPVGSAGRASALSFYPTKNLGALGDAGALFTADPALAEAARCLRDYGQRAKYEHARIGLNSRLDELHAAILARALLPNLSDWTARRCAVAARYRAELAQPSVTPLPCPAGSESVWHLFPVRVAPGLRASLMQHLKAHDIQSAVHYPALIPAQPALADTPFRVHGELRVAQALCSEELSLPIHPFLSDDHVSRVIAAVNAWSPA